MFKGGSALAFLQYWLTEKAALIAFGEGERNEKQIC
jgi:hypothetical protein